LLPHRSLKGIEPNGQASGAWVAKAAGHFAQIPNVAEGQTEVLTYRTAASSPRGCVGELRPAKAKKRAWSQVGTMERMNPDMEFDVDRYRKLLAEAVDETKRLALIDLLIEERAKERLEAEVAADRAATTVRTIAAVLSISRG
jgi:hypothetical protein